jgi:hypothetical protein
MSDAAVVPPVVSAPASAPAASEAIASGSASPAEIDAAGWRYDGVPADGAVDEWTSYEWTMLAFGIVGIVLLLILLAFWFWRPIKTVPVKEGGADKTKAEDKTKAAGAVVTTPAVKPAAAVAVASSAATTAAAPLLGGTVQSSAAKNTTDYYKTFGF